MISVFTRSSLELYNINKHVFLTNALTSLNRRNRHDIRGKSKRVHSYDEWKIKNEKKQSIKKLDKEIAYKNLDVSQNKTWIADPIAKRMSKKILSSVSLEKCLSKQENSHLNADNFGGILLESVNVLKSKFRNKEFDHHKPLKDLMLSSLEDKEFGKLVTTHSPDAVSELESTLINQINKSTPERLNEYDLSFEDYINPSISKLLDILYFIGSRKTPKSTVSNYDPLKNMNEQFQKILEIVFYNILRNKLTIFTPSNGLSIDMSNPAEWFPLARKFHRKIFMHLGPTNSGKTYNALQRLKNAKSGFYASPLRLLAREVYERFKSEGRRCNLITGEEIILDCDEFGNPAPISSGTIEMLSTTQEYDVVILDEIQMLGNEQRGWAWTNALLGAVAREVHLCGEETASDIVRNLAELSGEPVFETRYKRLGKLRIENKPLSSQLNALQRGDCIVSFSKKSILSYKSKIEKETDLKCAVIYGNLPPEIRTTQAAGFNSGDYDVLVASDAIGMGLNLKINRVVFSQYKKFDGNEKKPLTVSEVRQIGGRAGRFKVSPLSNLVNGNKGSDSDNNKVENIDINKDDIKYGYISAFSNEILNHVKNSFLTRTTPIMKACLWPPDNIWAQYISEFDSDTSLYSIIESFEKIIRGTRHYFACEISQRLELTKIYQDTPWFPMTDQIRLSNAPAGTRNPEQIRVFVEYCKAIAFGERKSIFDFNDSIPFGVLLNERELEDVYEIEYKELLGLVNQYVNLSLDAFKMDDEGKQRLSTLEDIHKAILLFNWLSYRYPTIFIDREHAVELKELCEANITAELKKTYDNQNKIRQKLYEKAGIKTNTSGNTKNNEIKAQSINA
ncbi:ATP-dependent RNA helicase SUV3 [Ascoidea rubescens DSM 1968]|uniref:ATP-dependent RNA helicase SUV3, mitochondrial n=1 Tax=Ascoidea rubescens DSM 1968 TaxID=1344418 RepID=A0A1D2VM85_9ASCO|nr:P-loop containing nucleoside triphosphate hydrolase protein [Ascoidea rubescens DSM 1968]ODV62728.1 P-loop containing nucleoside triphosphate hydrolase protein [Ascoidea rubescens DSM 1968]